MTGTGEGGTLIFPDTPRRSARPVSLKEEVQMSRIRLLAVIAGALLTLAFASSALASGGGSPGNDDVTGGARADHIALEAGDDNARGGRGNDVLDGGRGD